MAGISGQMIQFTGKIMLTRSSCSFLRRAYYNITAKSINYSTSAQESADRDPAPFFFNKEIQSLLTTLTRPDMKKIFRKRKDGSRIEDPVYKFMTDAELQKTIKEAEQRGKRHLQMPPVVKARKETIEVVSKDPAVQGHDTCSYVFTDITYPMNDYQRIIVVREPNGLLRHVNWDERHRINQIYYPMKGREMRTPRMFQDEHLKPILARQDYEFILDRACIQFEPNDPEFHRVTQTVYAAINTEGHFESLRSTRHFGPLVFHLVWTRNIDNLLLENINTDRLEDAVLLINLYHKIYPNAKTAALQHDGDDMEFVRSFISVESPIRGKFEIALNALKELWNVRASVAEGVKKAHGM